MIKLSHAVLAGFALIAVAIVIIGKSDHARAGTGDDEASYNVAVGGGFGLIVNDTTGETWRCDATHAQCEKLQLAK